MAAATVVLPTPPLPVITTSSRSSTDCTAVAVCLKPEPAGCTYNRAMTNNAGDAVDEKVEYDRDGLVPCVVQDWSTGEVLTLAYMNEEALRRTRDTGELHLWSRSRGEQWHKGESSGNVQTLRSLRLDCDGDTLLALVEPVGPACHTGERSCFHRGDVHHAAPYEALPTLERTLRQRARERPAGSYTVELLDDPGRIGQKVMEEAEEVARAVREESDERIDQEAADVLYHLLVLLRSRDRSLADAERVLDGRRS
jgi:phosphoribosyl-AMP cyclohydrolase / phosphoribosyl-ATP pyrophosphohydrolase